MAILTGHHNSRQVCIRPRLWRRTELEGSNQAIANSVFSFSAVNKMEEASVRFARLDRFRPLAPRHALPAQPENSARQPQQQHQPQLSIFALNQDQR
jgi:hypothetical protein